MQSILKISGMHCASCKALIEDVAIDTAGVQSCEVDLEKGLAVIHHDDSQGLARLIAELEGLETYTVEKV